MQLAAPMRTRLWLGLFGAVFGLVGVAAGCGGDGLFEGSGASSTTDTTTTGGQTSTTTTSQGGGTGGSGASGGAGGAGPIEPECTMRGDCQLVNDCCACMGFPADVDPP